MRITTETWDFLGRIVDVMIVSLVLYVFGVLCYNAGRNSVSTYQSGKVIDPHWHNTLFRYSAREVHFEGMPDMWIVVEDKKK